MGTLTLFSRRRVLVIAILVVASALSSSPEGFYVFFESLFMRKLILCLGLCALVTPLAWRLALQRPGGRRFARQIAAFIEAGVPRRRQHPWLVTGWSLLLVGAALGLIATVRMEPSADNQALYAWLTRESGPWERLGAFSLLGAGIILIVNGTGRWRGGGDRLPATTPLILGVVLLLAAGEEMSWGQHRLGFETPSWLAQINLQQELNLHNIGGYWSARLLLLALFLYVGILPVLEHFFVDVRFLTTRAGLPIAPLAFVPWGIVLAFLGDHPRLTALWGGSPPAWRYSEVSETLFAMLMLGLALDYRLGLRDVARQPGPPAENIA